MKNRVVILLLIILAAGGLIVWYLFAHSAAPSDRLKVSGNIEVTEVQVSFKIPGRVEARFVDEGYPVKKNQPIAELDQSDLKEELAIRQGELGATQAALRELEAGTRPEDIAVARAAVKAAEADLSDAKSNYDRLKNLGEALAAKQELDTARARFHVAQARLTEAQKRLELAVKGPRMETIDQARARVRQAKSAVALAQTRLGYAVVTAPLTGVVLSKNIEPGEYVLPGTPIVTLGDLINAWVRAYINETDLGRIKLGQPVDVTADTYPGKVYPGRVSFIASEAEFTPKNVQTQKERVKLVYRIKIDVPNPTLELKPGMPVDAAIQINQTATQPTTKKF